MASGTPAVANPIIPHVRVIPVDAMAEIRSELQRYIERLVSEMLSQFMVPPELIGELGSGYAGRAVEMPTRSEGERE